MDKKNDEIAHRRIVPGREIPRKYGQNNNSPATGHCRKAQPDWQQAARACLDEVARTEFGRLFVREAPTFQETCDRLLEPNLGDADRIRITRTVEELYTFSPLISRTRRRDIGQFKTRKPETISI